MVEVVVKVLVRETFYFYLWKWERKDAASLLQPWRLGCQAIAMYLAPERSVANNCQYSGVVYTSVLYCTINIIKLVGKKV